MSESFTIPHEVIGLEIKYDNVIKAWRTFLKMSHEELAEKTKITEEVLSQIENPGAKPDNATVDKMVKAMNIKSEFLES